MFNELKRKLTLQFVLLSSAVYIGMTVVVLLLFNFALTTALDRQLEEVIAVARKIVQYNGQYPYFESHPTDVHKIHLRLVVQLYDTQKHLCGSYGVPGDESFFDKLTEVTFNGKSYRCLARPIERSGVVIGYLQVQAPTIERDRALEKLSLVSLIMAPFLILGLAASGYWFSSIAIKPVEHTYGLQKRFLSDAGHELKTPVSIMLATLDNLSDTVGNDAASLDRVEKLRRAARRMDKLVYDLLLLTKTEQYAEPLATAPVEVDMVLREVMGELDDLFQDKNVELVGDRIDNALMHCHAESIRTIFGNLIKNAMIYTSHGGSVTVTLTRVGTSTVLKVADTGVGISEENLKKLFDRFFRVDESRSRIEGGSGLGLAIVKAMVEKHRGTINVDSVVGKGTTFTVTFPSA